MSDLGGGQMGGHLSAGWFVGPKTYGHPKFPAWLWESSHVVVVSGSPWRRGEPYKPLGHSTVLGVFLLPVQSC